jgi:hypothetical protein
MVAADWAREVAVSATRVNQMRKNLPKIRFERWLRDHESPQWTGMERGRRGEGGLENC